MTQQRAIDLLALNIRTALESVATNPSRREGIALNVDQFPGMLAACAERDELIAALQSLLLTPALNDDTIDAIDARRIKAAWAVLTKAGQPFGRTCDMLANCAKPVSHIGEKGYVYCAAHAPWRQGVERCRKMRPWELDLIRAGRALPSYKPGPKPKAVQS